MLSVYASLALVLAAIGLFGVMSFSVAQRGREMGIRMAVGASARELLRLVLWDGARLLLVGLAIGSAAAIALSWLMRGFLYQVEPADPAAIAAAIATLTASALVATLLPALRAARTDPARSLRAE
jgi:ABC-type antimicrobial peptide transport system permease subunit